ncbi:putative signal recognition particle subunit SRP72 [Apostichopus japonicus]|uniref:Signal recognition particle subunit SRP72 n=1 Tax=Stichopus japonicus TaxID=307972 RepID=A0A2G8JC01_STIJA|nr:putative signal recognition particle subunit SRP72 [Apostichopus japonicus]
MTSHFTSSSSCSNSISLSSPILKLNREDAVAFKCKIVCLIHQSDFALAIKEIANNPNLASDLMFEKAYCQYRLNKVPESLKTLRNITEPDDKVKELLGQVLYRLEEYSECLDIYKDLIKNSSEDPGLSEENYELSFNKASLLAGKGKFKEALEELDHAEELCKEGLDEEDDEEAELGIIRVQRGYVLQLMGKTDKAMALYNQVVKARPSDIGLLAVASNNIISLNKDQNVFDSKKKIRATQVAGLENKVTKHQQNTLSYNRCLFYLYTNQFENCRKQLKKLKGEDGDTLVMIEAALFTREKRIEKAFETLQDYISKENASIRVKLSLAQLFLSQGHVNKACDVLQALGDDQYAPGVVSTLVALYTNMDDVDSALKVLDGAVSWYKTQGGPQKDLNTLLRESTDFKMRHGQSQAATTLLEDLRKANPDDIKTLAQLISAYSKFDPKRAQELSQELPPVKELSGNIDVDALETTPLSVTTRQLKKGATVPATEEKVTGGPAAPETEQKKRKKKRKAKLPKNYDPSATPDPERWQPMRERAAFRTRKRYKKQTGVGKGTQGATSGASEMDASGPGSPKPGSNSSSNPASPAPSKQQAPRQQKPAQAAARKKQSKKKKKGGW